MLPPTMPPTTGPLWRPMRITTGEPSGALSVAHSFCISRARRAMLSAFSCSVLFSPGTQPVDAMNASLDVLGERAEKGESGEGETASQNNYGGREGV